MKLYKQLRTAIETALPEIKGAGFDFQPSPENQPGDVGLACFRFAKALKKSPPEIATQLAGIDYPPVIAEAVQTGPYVNFTLDRTAFATGRIGEIIEKGIESLRNKFKQDPIAFELLPEKFTLSQLQKLHEAIAGVSYDRRNFREKITHRK